MHGLPFSSLMVADWEGTNPRRPYYISLKPFRTLPPPPKKKKKRAFCASSACAWNHRFLASRITWRSSPLACRNLYWSCARFVASHFVYSLFRHWRMCSSSLAHSLNQSGWCLLSVPSTASAESRSADHTCMLPTYPLLIPPVVLPQVFHFWLALQHQTSLS